jgi:hypothetical protein
MKAQGGILTLSQALDLGLLSQMIQIHPFLFIILPGEETSSNWNFTPSTDRNFFLYKAPLER